MRVVNFALSCAVLLLLTSAFAGAQDNLTRNFRLQFYGEYCDCDDDCGTFSSCLSSDTDLFVKNMNTQSGDKIKEAQAAGFRGICTEVTMNGELMVYAMTTECSEYAQPEKDLDNTAPGSTQPADTSSTNRVITVSFNGDKKTNSSTSSPKTTTAKKTAANTTNKSTGGQNMDLITAGIIAGTIILVGFFGLMAWMAYLLQKKTVEKTDRMPKK
ncbi:MAG: hypothetical protein KKE20_04840 [Nanoarchaeota archaeon]|nr:hypothetical protein [Nanoarchaeota archaeon]